MSNDTPVKSSPLSQISLSTHGVDAQILDVNERPFVGYINLRGSVVDSTFKTAVNAVIEGELPEIANTFIQTSEVAALWLGPDEWLLVCEPGKGVALHERLRDVLSDCHSAITDVSGGHTLIELSGAKARNLLEKGCPLDLHNSKFSTGQCAQSIIDKTGVTLFQTADETYKVIIRRSFADYFGVWLLDAAREFAA